MSDKDYNVGSLPLWAEFERIDEGLTKVSPRSNFELHADEATHATNADHATATDKATVADSLDTSAETLGVPYVRIEESTFQFNGSGGGIGEININDTLGKVLFDPQTFFRSSFSTPQFSDARTIDETTGENCNIPKTFLMGSYLGVIYNRSSTNYFYQSFWNGSSWSTPNLVASVVASYGASVESPNYLWTAYVRNSDGYILVSSATTKSITPSYSFSTLNSYTCSYIDMVYYNSEIYVFYCKNSDGKTYYKKKTEAGAWSNETLCSNTTLYWKACVVYNNNLYVFFKSGADKKIYYAKYNGSTWTETVLDNIRTFGSYTIGATVYKNLIYITAVSDTGTNTRPIWWTFNGTTVTDIGLGAGTAVQPFMIDCETYNNELFFIHQHPVNTSLTGWLYSQKLVTGQYNPSFLGIGIESSGSNNYGMWWKLGNGLVIQIAITPIVSTTFAASSPLYTAGKIVYLPYPFKTPNYFHWDVPMASFDNSGTWCGPYAQKAQYKDRFLTYVWQFTSTTSYVGTYSLVIGYDE